MTFSYILHADLVILDSRISPHDLDYMNAFVKPKLLEDSKAEGSKCGFRVFHVS